MQARNKQELFSKIQVSKHAIKSWQKIHQQWFQEFSQAPEKDIIKMLEQAREVESAYPGFKTQELIRHQSPARHFRFGHIMIVTDKWLRNVITVYPILYPKSWKPRGVKRKMNREK